MSARAYKGDVLTNSTRPVEYAVLLQGAGTGTPTIVDGDVNGATSGTYVTVARTGTGVITVKTTDPFPAVAGMGAVWCRNTPGGQNNAEIKAAQNADNTWTFTISLFVGTTATDAGASDQISLWARFRNGLNQP